MAVGWIKVYRKMMDSPKYTSEAFCRNMAWIDLLMLANRSESFFRVRGITVKVLRGQVGHTSEHLGERWKWSRGKVNRFLNELEIEQQIVQQKNRVTTLISILNYDRYQLGGTTDEQEIGQQTVQQTIQQVVQQTVQQTDIDKEDKKIRSKEKDINYTPPDKVEGSPEPVSENGISKGVFEWTVKSDFINFKNPPPLWRMPSRQQVQDMILEKVIPFAPTKETVAFMTKCPIQPSNHAEYRKMLMCYGIAKYLHDSMISHWDVNVYKDLQKARTDAWTDVARQMLQIDKRSPSDIKDLIQWVYGNDQDDFWKNTMRSMNSLRKHYDQIMGKMVSFTNSGSGSQNNNSVTFSINKI